MGCLVGWVEGRETGCLEGCLVVEVEVVFVVVVVVGREKRLDRNVCY